MHTLDVQHASTVSAILKSNENLTIALRQSEVNRAETEQERLA